MKIKIARLILYIIITVWLSLWINFILRDLFKGHALKEYMILVKQDDEGRRSYTFGDDFYQFLKYAKEKIPQACTYSLVGVEQLEIDHRRAVYYLYPLLPSNDAEYILVYKKLGHKNPKYTECFRLDENRYILKRKY